MAGESVMFHLSLRPLLFFLGVCILFATGVNAVFASSDGPMPVIVSIAPQKYLLERIAGDRVNVTVLVKPGADPHTYEPTPAQMLACTKARAWFTIGVPFEDIWLPRIVQVTEQKRGSEKLADVSTIKGITILPFENSHAVAGDGAPIDEKMLAPQDTHAHGLVGEDPHVWLSPMLVRAMLPGLAKELGKMLPEYADEFRANAENLAAELETLDAEIAGRFAKFPPHKRVFLTVHPSWRYFARNYDLIGASIETEGKEPNPREMQSIADWAKEQGIRVIFVEPQFSQSAAKAIAENLGVRIEEVDPLAEDLLATYTEMADKLIKSFTETADSSKEHSEPSSE